MLVTDSERLRAMVHALLWDKVTLPTCCSAPLHVRRHLPAEVLATASRQVVLDYLTLSRASKVFIGIGGFGMVGSGFSSWPSGNKVIRSLSAAEVNKTSGVQLIASLGC